MTFTSLSHRSVGKESASNAGDPDLIPELEDPLEEVLPELSCAGQHQGQVGASQARKED